jgi:release factor glutamine methyltransferase
VPTVGEVLPGAIERLRDAGSESARLDAEVLLAFAAGTERTTLLAHPELLLPPYAQERFDEGVARRSRGEPVAYIRGVKEFFGLAFAVDPRALIPRPETERLVEAGRDAVMARLTAAGRGGGRGAAPPAPVRVIDVGTGSGAIVIGLAVELRRRKVDLATDVTLTATDTSPDALQLARENAVGHAVGDVVTFVEADLLPLEELDGGHTFDVVLANLPYVRTGAIAGLPVAASFEPIGALDGGADGLAVIRRLLGRLPDALAGGGVALLEIGADQGSEAVAAVEDVVPGWTAAIETDLAGLPRILRVERRGTS